MDKTIHCIRAGGRGGVANEEEYRRGETTCGAEDRPKCGQPFERRG